MRFKDLDDITMADLNFLLKNHASTKKDTLNAMMYGAWHSAAFYRSKKMPKLKECMLKDKKPSKPVKTDEIKDLAERNGVKIPKG